MSSSRTKILRGEDIRLVEGSSAEPTFTHILAGRSDAPRGGRISDVERLRREFEERLQGAVRESYEKGLREGTRRGREEQLAESRRTLDALSALTEGLSSLKREILEQSEPEVLEMVFAVAEKVLHREVAERPDAVVPVLRAAMRSVLDRDGVKIRLNPVDYRHIQEIREDFFRQMDGLRNVVFEEDESIGPGGVFIETRFGDVDARLDRQLAEVRTQVLQPAQGSQTEAETGGGAGGKDARAT